MDYDAIMAWGTRKMKEADEWPLEPGYRFYHGQRVASLAVQLAEQMDLKVSMPLLKLGGFLHDVGKAGYKGKGHAERGAELIRAEIPHLFSVQELGSVTTIVAYHNYRPKTLGGTDHGFPVEVLLVQDADSLDHFGCNGLWLGIHWDTFEKRTQLERIARHRSKDVAWYTDVMAELNFEASRNELRHRMEWMENFIQMMEQENQGQLTSRLHKP